MGKSTAMLLHFSWESIPLSPIIQTPETDVYPLTLAPLLTPALWESSLPLNILSTPRVLAKTIIANKKIWWELSGYKTTSSVTSVWRHKWWMGNNKLLPSPIIHCSAECNTLAHLQKILLFLWPQNHPQSQREFAKRAQLYKRSTA